MKPRQDLHQAITKELRALVPDATAIIFFGSRVQGLASPTSDYDIMVLTPTGVDLEERERIKKILKIAFPNVILDLVFGSERFLLAHLGMEPYYRFWLENGVATYGRVPRIKHYPRLYRDALDSRLDVIRAELGVVDAASHTLFQRGRGYLGVLKQLALIENALQGDYSNESLWANVEKTVGNPTFQILRDPSQRHRIRKPMITGLRRRVVRKFSQLRQANLRSRYTTDTFPKRIAKHAKSQG